MVRDAWLDGLRQNGQLVVFCPEMEAGLGTPRPPIEMRDGEIIRQDGQVLTNRFAPALKKLETLLKEENIELAVLKENSPSCGVRRIYDGSFSGRKKAGQGLIASFLSSKIPVFSEAELDQARASFQRLNP